jgi:hypothetical protein
MREEIMAKALAAKDKKALYGPDIDIEKFQQQTPARERITSLSALSKGVQDRALQAGVDASMKERSGTFFMHDQTVVHTATVQEGLEIMDINDALAKDDWLQDYFFKLVKPDAGKYTAYSASHPFVQAPNT